MVEDCCGENCSILLMNLPLMVGALVVFVNLQKRMRGLHFLARKKPKYQQQNPTKNS